MTHPQTMEVQRQLLHAEIIGRIIGKIGQEGPAEEVSRQAAGAESLGGPRAGSLN